MESLPIAGKRHPFAVHKSRDTHPATGTVAPLERGILEGLVYARFIKKT